MIPNVLFAVLFCTTVLAQDPRPVALYTRTGDTLHAVVLDLDRTEGRVALRLHVLGGHMDVRRRIADFEPESQFLMEKLQAKGDGFETNFTLAKRAGELRLMDLAGSHARAAIDAFAKAQEGQTVQQDVPEIHRVRTWAADLLEETILEAVQQNDPETARHRLKLLATRLPDLRSEEQLGQLAETVDMSFAARAREKSLARQARLTAVQQAEIERRLKPLKERAELGDRLLRDALKSARTPSQSARLAERAIETYRSALGTATELKANHDAEDELAEEIEVLSQHLHDSGIRAALHVANVLTVRSDYKGAMEWAQRALAYEPGNAEAKRMVRTIQIAAAAASAEWGWGWGWGVRTAGRGGGQQPEPEPQEPPKTGGGKER